MKSVHKCFECIANDLFLVLCKEMAFVMCRILSTYDGSDLHAQSAKQIEPVSDIKVMEFLEEKLSSIKSKCHCRVLEML